MQATLDILDENVEVIPGYLHRIHSDGTGILHYHIHHNGRRLGHIEGQILDTDRGHELLVNNFQLMGRDQWLSQRGNRQMTVRPGVVRQVQKQLQQRHPNVRWVSGFRITGLHQGGVAIKVPRSTAEEIIESFLSEHKYHNDDSMVCGHCGGSLKVKDDIVTNQHHIYPHGQTYTCKCGKSSVWTNSIRNPEHFVAVGGSHKDYYQGFCNDTYCGHCHQSVGVLKTGDQMYPGGNHYERYGCEHCDQNQRIFTGGSGLRKVPDNTEIHQWYGQRMSQLKKLVTEALEVKPTHGKYGGRFNIHDTDTGEHVGSLRGKFRYGTANWYPEIRGLGAEHPDEFKVDWIGNKWVPGKEMINRYGPREVRSLVKHFKSQYPSVKKITSDSRVTGIRGASITGGNPNVKVKIREALEVRPRAGHLDGRFDIHHKETGEYIGGISGIFSGFHKGEPTKFHVDMIAQLRPGKNNLGPTEIKSLVRDFKTKYPSVKRIVSDSRVTGVRGRLGLGGNVNVKIPKSLVTVVGEDTPDYIDLWLDEAISIEPMKRRQAGTLASLDKAAFAGEGPELLQTKGEFAAAAKRPQRGHDVFVAREPGAPPAGYGLISRVTQHHANIDSLAVDPGMQGRKIGDKIFTQLIQHARNRGFKTLGLQVRQSNVGAHKLYLRHGFRPVNILPHYYGKGEHGIEMHVKL